MNASNDFYMELLSDIVNFSVNKFAHNDCGNLPLRIADKYNRFSEPDIIDFNNFISEIFADNINMQIMVQAAIYHITRSRYCLLKISDLSLSDGISYDISMALYQFSSVELFRRGLKRMDYSYELNIIRQLSSKLKSLINIPSAYVPFQKRNPKRIVIMTGQLLSESHAPSHIVFTICNILQNILGYDILLVVAAEYYKSYKLISEMVFDHYEELYDNRLWGLNNVRYDNGSPIQIYQFRVGEQYLNETVNAYCYIRDYNPMYIWNIGGKSTFSELFNDICTVATMPCQSGFPVTDSSILIRYMRRNEPEAERFIESTGKDFIDMDWFESISLPASAIDRVSLGFDSNDYLIAVMGNRLDTEIDDTFIKIMMDSINQNPQIKYLLIGKCDIDFKKYSIDDNVCKLGYRDDYMSLLAMADLCVNPRREGGGSSASAVFCGTPVLTLGNCDVGDYIGEPFTYDNYDNFANVISKYIHDEEFKECQHKACETITHKYASFNLNEELIRVEHVICGLIAKK